MAEVFVPKLRSSTVNQYEGLIRNHLRPLRDVRLSKLTVSVLEELPLPDEFEYSVEVIDTWEMTIDRLPRSFRGRCMAVFPANPI